MQTKDETNIHDIALILSLSKKDKEEVKKWLDMVYKLGYCDGVLDSINQMREVKNGNKAN